MNIKFRDGGSVRTVLDKHILTDGFDIVVDLDKSNGSYLVDLNTGKKYLDCFSQFASQPLGWNHPKVVNQKDRLGRIALHKIANSDCYCEEYAEFVETFAANAPDFKHFFFIDGGALAVENTLKAAFDWKAKKLGIKDGQSNELNVIYFKEAFHGRTGYTLSLTNNPTNNLKTRFFPKFNWTRVDNPKITFPQNDAKILNLEKMSLNETEAILKNNRTAAILMEPIQGEGGDNHFRKEFFQALRKLADKYEALLVMDEVQTGVGLTGKMWAYEHFGFVPDMIAFGKKTQVCGICSTDRIDEVPHNVFKISSRINSTWGGNLVDMTRCKIFLDIISEDNLIENSKEVGEYFLEKLKNLPINNVRGRGLMIAFDLEDETKRDTFLQKLLKKGVLALSCGQKSVRVRPHLTFSKENVDEAIDIIESSF